MTIPRQLAPTVGPAHGGVVFLEGALPEIEKLAIGRMRKSRRGNYYVNSETWGPEFASVESGFQVPFGKINVFVGFVGGARQEPAQESDSVSEAATAVHSDGESSVGNNDLDETESIHPLFDERLGGDSDEKEYPASHGSPRHTAVYMAGPGAGPYYDAQGNLVTAPPGANTSQNQVLGQATAAAAAPGVSTMAAAGGGNQGTQGLAAIAAALNALLVDAVTPENAAERATEIENFRQQLARVQQDIAVESARLNTAQAEIMQEVQFIM